jgi:hypothetical protein
LFFLAHSDKCRILVVNVTFDSCIMAVSIIVGGNWSNWSKPSPPDTDKLYAIIHRSESNDQYNREEFTSNRKESSETLC